MQDIENKNDEQNMWNLLKEADKLRYAAKKAATNLVTFD